MQTDRRYGKNTVVQMDRMQRKGVNRTKKGAYFCFCWFIMMFVALVPQRTTAQTETSQEAKTLSIFEPKEMAVNAKSAVLMDGDTGEILVENKKDYRIPPASFAKILTLYIVFDMIKRGRLKFDDKVFVSKKAWRTGGSKMFIEVNSKVEVQELIKGIAIVSGNDACVALAEHIYGSTDIFVNVMNETAQKLGMKNSRFTNPHGFPKGRQFTTSYDMALLARSYIRNFPEVLQFHSKQEYTYGGIRQRNRNGLLRQDSSVDGLKTGYTEKGGYHLLATAKRGNQRLIAVVMGAETPAIREKEARKLLNYGYRNYELLSLFSKGQVLAKVPVWKGVRDTVSLVPADSGIMTIPVEYKDAIHEEREVPSEVVAPVHLGQVIGKVIVKLNADIIKSVPLVADHEVHKAGLFKSFSHSVYLMGKKKTGLFSILAAILVSLGVGYVFFTSRRRRKRRRSSLRF